MTPSGRLGIELAAYALTASYFQGLVAAFQPGTQFENTGGIVSALRLIKSPAELEYVHAAQGHNLADLEAFFRNVAEGCTEIRLSRTIEQAMREHGSDYPAMPTCLHSGPRTGLSVAERLGESHTALIRWGYGIGIGYPPAWREPL